ncbi:MAG: hypothetical protein NTV88_01950 [Candidatus Micrarchaeota archaeon]|nr:hypothetical protein [Candidatus Micrarchaeota archaeon]
MTEGETKVMPKSEFVAGLMLLLVGGGGYFLVNLLSNGDMNFLQYRLSPNGDLLFFPINMILSFIIFLGLPLLMLVGLYSIVRGSMNYAKSKKK